MGSDRHVVGIPGSEVLEQRLSHDLVGLEAQIGQPCSPRGRESQIAIRRPEHARQVARQLAKPRLGGTQPVCRLRRVVHRIPSQTIGLESGLDHTWRVAQ